jgi:hypothetical protein
MPEPCILEKAVEPLMQLQELPTINILPANYLSGNWVTVNLFFVVHSPEAQEASKAWQHP